jgi:hypothetical protein
VTPFTVNAGTLVVPALWVMFVANVAAPVCVRVPLFVKLRTDVVRNEFDPAVCVILPAKAVAFNVVVPAPVCVMFPTVARESTVVAFRVAVVLPDCVMLPAVEKFPAPVCWMAPVVCREATDVPCSVLKPDVCEILPPKFRTVCVPILVTFSCVAVVRVPVKVAPDTSLLATTPPVTVTLDPVMAPLEAMVVPVTLPLDVNVSAVTVPVNTVFPTEVDPILVNTFEMGAPLTVKLVQLTLVEDTLTASRFLT